MILLSPAKTFNLTKHKSRAKIDYFNYQKTNTLYRFLHDLSFEQLGEYLSVKNKTLDTTYKYYHEHQYSYRAIDLYKGIAFKEINEIKDYDYVQENLYIIDAYYGLINGCDFIHPYRLDFTNDLVIHREDWQDEINDYIINTIAPPYILNLASNEFSQLLDRKRLGHIIYDIQIKATAKVNSTMLKKIRGQIFNYMMEHQINELSQLASLSTPLIKSLTLEGQEILLELH